jgi:hypothetical protein
MKAIAVQHSSRLLFAAIPAQPGKANALKIIQGTLLMGGFDTSPKTSTNSSVSGNNRCSKVNKLSLYSILLKVQDSEKTKTPTL